MIKIGVPVKCQNGHKAVWIMHITGFECYQDGVPKDEQCQCPKNDLGEGWHACGEPFIIEKKGVTNE